MKETKWIVADTEDDSKELLKSGRSGFDKRITQIAARCSDGTRFYNRGNVVAFLEWLLTKRPCKVYFHNLRYDLGNLFGCALDLPDVQLVGGRLIFARWRGIVFHDSLNLWPMSVERLGIVVGLEKLAFGSCDARYVKRDVDIVYRAIELGLELSAEFGIDHLPATIGGLAVKIWKAMGGGSWFDDWAGSRMAYYGGRVELFRTEHRGEISYIDLNSLYPWAMTQRFPTEIVPQKDLDSEGIAAVTIKIPEDTFLAPLPVRQDDGSIIYPTGMLDGVWTTHEIRTALRYGAQVLKLDEVWGAKTTDLFYRDFVQEFYGRRQRSKDAGEREFYKRLLNNLYGQQAMSGMVSRSVYKRAHHGNGIVYGDKVLIEMQCPLPEHVNYLHAAYVTSYGRTRLLYALHAIPPDKLIYCDTDSIIHAGPPILQMSSELGEFKLEKTWQYCRTFGPKCYDGFSGPLPVMAQNPVRKREAKAKGVPSRLAADFLDWGHVEYDQPFGLREAIIGYDQENQKQLSVWRKVEKEQKTRYLKKKEIDGQYWPLIQN